MFDIDYNPKTYADIQTPEVIDRRIFAWNLIKKNGLPTRKDEGWRYTDFNKWLIQSNLLLTPIERSSNWCAADFKKHISQDKTSLVFVDGFFEPELSDLSVFANKKITVDEINSTALEVNDSKSHCMVKYFNDALFSSGVRVSIPSEVEVDLELVYLITSNSEQHVRCLKNHFHLDTYADVRISEKYISLIKNPILMNVDNSINLRDNASLNYCLELNQDQNNLINIGRFEVNQSKDSKFEYFNLLFGGSLNRHEMNINLNAPGAYARVDGVFISKDSMNVDNNITVVHNASHTTSDVCFKGIASGKSSATFNAKAIVQKGLVAIKALQSNKNLLLDKTATINTKPELEIYSDDVVCSHGATIGQLDKNLIFYFQSRGISYNEAITMLTVAFLIDILERQSLNGSQKEKFSVQIEDYSSKIIS